LLASSLEQGDPTLLDEDGIDAGPEERFGRADLVGQCSRSSTRETGVLGHEHPGGGRLGDLFGPRARWGTTLRNLLWTNVHTTLPAFEENVLVDLPIPCTYDLNVAAAKYFHSLQEGSVPLTLLFSGTVFYEGEQGVLQVSPVPWSKQARFALPVATWKEVIDLHFPNAGYVTLQREVLDRLYRYKVRRGLPTWERALESLLARAEAEA